MMTAVFTNAQTRIPYAVPGNYTVQEAIGATSYYATQWGGGGAGRAGNGGGGSPVTNTKWFNIDSSTVIQLYVGRGGFKFGNPSGDGENSWIVTPAGVKVFSGYGKIDGTIFWYPLDSNRVSYGAEQSGGKGGADCSNAFAGGGGGGAGRNTFEIPDGGNAVCGVGTASSGVGGGGDQTFGRGGNGSNFYTSVRASGGNDQGGGGGGLGFFINDTATGGNGRLFLLFRYDGGSGGIIANPYSVPYPRESEKDSIRSIAQASGYNPGGTSIIYRWEYSVNGTSWIRVPGINPGASCKLPPTDSVGYYYRRIATNVPYPDTISNVVKLRVFNKTNVNNGVPSKNGSIYGKVVSKNNPTGGIVGITVYAQKMIGLKSSPQSHIDSVVTGLGGSYQFFNLYYGDKDAPNNDPDQVTFKIWPAKPRHKFDPVMRTQALSFSNYNPFQTIDFKDTTVLSVTGRIFQQCIGCLNADNVVVDSLTAGVDSAKITGGDLPVYSMLDGSGNYAASVQDPGLKTFTPSFSYHQFNPASRSINVTDDVSGQHFEDTTTRMILGRLTDGGKDSIGTAILEFTDTVKGRTGYVFRKRVNVNSNGNYAVRLPARSYRVSIISFNSIYQPGNPRYITEGAIGTFFNQLFPKDSLIRNIVTENKTLDLVYHRPPVITVTQLADTSCNTAAGVIFFQNKRKPFSIKIFEGDPVIGFPLTTPDKVQSKDSLSAGDSVLMRTDLLDQVGNGASLTYQMRLIAGKADTAITAGLPNTTFPFKRQLFFEYTDRYGRAAVTLEKKTTTVGTLSTPGSFFTVAPEIPQLILHRPPGDGSYSFWEQTNSIENVQRLSVATGGGVDAFAEVKVGADFAVGIGMQVQTKIEASINASFRSSFTNVNENELLFASSTTNRYETKVGGTVGRAGDVYIGGALNYKHAVTSVLALKDSIGGCLLNLSFRLIVAPTGYATTFTYSEDHIKNTLMPALAFTAANLNGARRDSVQNQIDVWQQILDNNAYQKTNAEFIKNRSFDGNAGTITESRSFTKSSVNTLFFNLSIDSDVAAKIGATVNGTGIGGGVTVKVKSESGRSTQNTFTAATTTGYVLADANGGDYYSVDIKRDKVYGTPVFDLVAGASSCPPEPAAQSRDFPRIIIDTPVYNKISNNAKRFFKIKLVNLSQSRETRSYLLNVNNSTSDGLKINTTSQLLGGITPFPVNGLEYNKPREIELSVEKFNPNSNQFSWSDIEFTLTDDCGGDVEAVNYLSVNFVTDCSGIVMDEPADNWTSNATDQNIIPIVFSGYNTAQKDSVVVEYAKTGTNNWRRGMVIPGFQITNPAITQVPWNVSSLPDSMYKIRLQMYCSGGVKFTTPSVLGVLDRKSPKPIGKAQPADNVFANGDEISFTYNEKLNADNLSGINVSLIKLASGSLSALYGTPIPASFSVFNQKLTVVPLNDISSLTGDNFMVVANGLADVIGNTSITSDTSYFTVGGASIPGTAPSVKLYTSDPVKFEDSLATMQVRFKLPAIATRLTKVFYSISGTAIFENDYTVTTDTITRLVKDRKTNLLVPVPVYSYFNGSNGYMYIDSLKQEAVLRIKPIVDKIREGNETILVTLLSGGDYTLQDSTNAIVTILNDDALDPVIDSSGPLSLCGDSVLLTAKPLNGVQFASGVRSYSSQLGIENGAAKKLTGASDVYPAYGNYANAWSPATPDNAREFIEVLFSNPTPINFVDIYETYKPGSVDTVYVKNANTGLFEVVYTHTAAPLPDAARKLRIRFTTTSFAVAEIRLAMASGAVAGRSGIDAVAIGDSTPYTAYLWTPGGATSQSIWVKTTGDYSVRVTDANGLKGYSDTVKVKTSGVSGTLNVGPVLSAICPGSGTIDLGGSFTGGITSALWSDGGAGGIFSNNSGVNPGAVMYTAAAAANGTITLTLSTPACATTVSKTILINGETTWLGLTNNWNADSNWSLGKVPFACTMVHVMPGTPNAPVISGTNNTCKMLDIKPGTNVTVLANAALIVTGQQ